MKLLYICIYIYIKHCSSQLVHLIKLTLVVVPYECTCMQILINETKPHRSHKEKVEKPQLANWLANETLELAKMSFLGHVRFVTPISMIIAWP